jgi:fructoselysine-6-P-deglycase FrlB-like protein
MSTPAFDPDAPLPGPPEPWHWTSQPSLLDGPPFHMTRMIEAEPAVIGRILERHADPASPAGELARAIESTVGGGRPVVLTGCGTSEHGALAAAAILRDAVLHERATLIWSAQAFELALDPPPDGLVIGVSHEGSTGATNAALTAAKGAGTRTALITVSDRSPGAALVDIVVETGELDQSWCHTVGYTSPIAAATAVAAHLADRSLGPDERDQIRALMRAGLANPPALDRLAQALAQGREVLVIASGADRPAGRELVLKIEEGAWLPAAYRDIETFLHGHLAATDADTGIVLVLTDRDRRDARLARARGALDAARTVGMTVGAIVAEEVDAALPAELTPAGRLVVPDAADVPGPVAALLGSAIPLQRLAEHIATARGVNPDPIHRDVDRYRRAAEVAEAVPPPGE